MTDPDGRPVAHGWRDGEDHWLLIPAVGTYRFAAGEAVIDAYPEPGAAAGAVEERFHTIALPLALQASGFEALHASAVVMAGGVVAFCGYSGTGKTTTAYALGRRGHALWADDVVVLDVAPDGGATARALPYRFNLRAPTRAALAGDGEAPAGQARDAPLAAVVVLERAEGLEAPGIERLRPTDALQALLPHGFRVDLSATEARRRTVEHYLAIVARVPVLRARFSPGFDRLDALLDAIEHGVTGA